MCNKKHLYAIILYSILISIRMSLAGLWGFCLSLLYLSGFSGDMEYVIFYFKISLILSFILFFYEGLFQICFRKLSAIEEQNNI